MKISLRPLTTEEYPSWFEKHTQSYADDKVHAKQWGEKDALALAQKDTLRFLSEGIDTPNHYLCHIIDTQTQENVGSLWWMQTERFGRKVAFIFDIAIHEHYRRKGYATNTLKHLEERVRLENFEALSLHVFAFNTGAVALYHKLGFATTSLSMTREL